MTHPTVKLAGNVYAVPPLVPRQQRFALPTIMKLGNAIRVLPPGPNGEPRGAFDVTKLSPEFYDEIVIAVFWGAIWPNMKNATPDIMQDMQVSWAELMAAINVIREQTGLYGPAPEGATSGELSAQPSE